MSFIKENTAMSAVLFMLILGTILYGGKFMNYNRNLINVLHYASMLGVMGVGVNLCFLIGARDLSVSAVAAASSMFAAVASPYGVVASIAAGLTCGLIFGLFNGIIVAKFKVQPFIATLGTQLAARGVALLVNNERSVEIDTATPYLKNIGNYNIGGILPIPAAIFIGLILIMVFVTRCTPFGRSVYAVGGNEEAAEMMGIRVSKIKLMVFVISGLTAALTGIILAGHISAGQPTACEGWEMTIMAAIVIGGTSVRGGLGKISGIFPGVIFVQFITNLINLHGRISAYWKDILTGVILLIAVLLQVYSDSQKEKKKHIRNLEEQSV